MACLLLQKYPELGFLIVGGPDDKEYSDALSRDLGVDGSLERVVNLAGRTSIRDLIDIFNFSDLFITNDSGPAHLASLTKVPGIVLFGPETPDLYLPIGGRATGFYSGLDCQPCITVFNGKRSHCADNICLKRITAQDIISHADKILQDLGQSV